MCSHLGLQAPASLSASAAIPSALRDGAAVGHGSDAQPAPTLLSARGLHATRMSRGSRGPTVQSCIWSVMITATTCLASKTPMPTGLPGHSQLGPERL